MPEAKPPSDLGDPIVIKPGPIPLPVRPVGTLTRSACPKCGKRLRRVARWIGAERRFEEIARVCPVCDQAYTCEPITTSVVEYTPVKLQRTLAGVVTLDAALGEAKALPPPSEVLPAIRNREVKVAAIKAALPIEEKEVEP